MPPRRGFTLLQLLLVIAGLGIALGIAVLAKRASQDRSAVTALAYSPTGRLLAIGFSDGRVEMANPRAARTWTERSAHASSVYAMCFSHDNGKLATADEYGSVHVWNLDGWKRLQSFQHNSPVTAMDFSVDGALLATASDATRIWDVESGKLVRTLTGARFVRFSPEGRRVATIDYDDALTVWDVDTGRQQYGIEGPLAGFTWDALTTMAWSPDGEYLATGWDHGSAKLWEGATGKELQTSTLSESSGVAAIVFSQDGVVLAATVRRDSDAPLQTALRFWDVPSGKERRPLNVPFFIPMRYSNDAASLFGIGAIDPKIPASFLEPCVLDLQTGRVHQIPRRRLHSAQALVLAFGCWLWTLAWVRVCPNGEVLAVKLRALQVDRLKHISRYAHNRWALIAPAAVAALTIAATILLWLIPNDSPLTRGLGTLALGRPVAASLAGLFTGVAFMLPIIRWARKSRPLLLELVLVPARTRLRFARYMLAFVLQFYAMIAAVLLVAWTIQASVFLAILASSVATGLMYRQQAALYRAAQQRLAELKALKSEI